MFDLLLVILSNMDVEMFGLVVLIILMALCLASTVIYLLAYIGVFKKVLVTVVDVTEHGNNNSLKSIFGEL